MTASNGARTTFVATVDLLSFVRGRAVPTSSYAQAQAKGLGWVPANHVICLDREIGENPFGSCEDLRLIPDSAPVPIGASTENPTQFVLANLHTTDGRSWEACPRSWAKKALEKLRLDHGLGLVVGAEHEFYLLPDEQEAQPFSFGAFRSRQAVLDAILVNLEAANCEPETILPEFGKAQYELTCRPSPALEAVDRAIITREIIRDTARQFELSAVFSPLVRHTEVGNGFHVHISLVDRNGNNLTGDAQ